MARLGERAAGAMYWNLVGKVALMVVKYAESIVLVRLLGGEQYGALAGLLNLNAMVVLFASLGLENTLLRFLPEAVARGGPAAERRLVGQAGAIRLIVSLAVAAVLYLAAEPIARLILHAPEQAVLVRVVGLMVIGLGLQNLLSRVLVARYEQRFINLLQVALTTIYLVAAALTILAGGGVLGVMICQIALYGATLVFFGRRLRTAAMPTVENTFTGSPVTVRRLFQFSGLLYLYGVLHFVFEKGMDVLLLGALRDELVQVTWYVIGYNFAFFAVSFFSAAFSEGFTLAFVSEVAASGDEAKLKRVFAVFMEYMYLFIFPILIGGLLLGGDLLRLMYGETGEGAIVPMLILFFGLGVSKMGGITANFLQALNKEKALVKARLLFGAINLALDLAFIPLWGATGAAIATTIAVVAGIVYEWTIVHRALHPDYPVAFLAKVLAASLVMGAVVWWLGNLIAWHDLLRLPVLIVAGGVVFALLLIVLRPFRREYVELIDTLPLPGKKIWLKWMTPRD
ncbi:MAG TPA: polysaccharide biosynthesis C-terminal domain-containing protein [bacterium]|nr:polysaccharide biosynthesis C-terminal domain-containing protein [bacterium]